MPSNETTENIHHQQFDIKNVTSLKQTVKTFREALRIVYKEKWGKVEEFEDSRILAFLRSEAKILFKRFFLVLLTPPTWQACSKDLYSSLLATDFESTLFSFPPFFVFIIITDFSCTGILSRKKFNTITMALGQFPFKAASAIILTILASFQIPRRYSSIITINF